MKIVIAVKDYGVMEFEPYASIEDAIEYLAETLYSDNKRELHEYSYGTVMYAAQMPDDAHDTEIKHIPLEDFEFKVNDMVAQEYKDAREEEEGQDQINSDYIVSVTPCP